MPGKTTRSSNLELLRILCMLLIIGDHLTGQSGIADYTTLPSSFAFCLIGCGSRIACSVFVLIGGWFLCEQPYKTRRPLSLWLSLWLYTVPVTLLCKLAGLDVSWGALRWAAFPASTRQLWFISDYLLLLFCVPLLNRLLRGLSRPAHRGLLAVLVAFVGASFAARTLSPMVADALEPKFASAIEEQLNASIQQQVAEEGSAALSPDDVPLDGVLNALREMGFYETLINTVDKAVENGMTSVAASAAAAVAAAIAQSAAYLILFLLGFALILIAWKLISHALDLVARLPGLHFLNKTCGALFGLVQACVLLFVAAWLLQFFGHVLPESLVNQTHLLKFFMTTNPLSLLSGL